jgi:hypothetical protein
MLFGFVAIQYKGVFYELQVHPRHNRLGAGRQR